VLVIVACITSLSFAPVNELSGDELPSAVVYQTRTAERGGIRWYTSVGETIAAGET
jgi:hypothetical protein